MMEDTVGAFVPHSPTPLKGNPDGPLAGLTFAVKDLFDTAGDISGCGSPLWYETHDPATATSPLVTRLLDAGADMIGKTVCDELFYSFSGENAHYGTPTNCRAPGRLPGGSSSGSAAAVAAGLCDFSLGSDTGGSIRAPASFCGLYGLRPTHGRIDLSNAQAMAPSFDTAGWFADKAGLFQKIAPYMLDDNSVPESVERVLLGTFAFNHSDEEVSQPLLDYVNSVRDRFPAWEDVDTVPGGIDLDEAREAFRIIQAFEVWQTFGGWVTDVQPELGPGVKERIQMASEITREERDTAAVYWEKVRNVMQDLITPGTLLCLPTTAALPLELDAPLDTVNSFRVKVLGLICLAGLSSLPQISLPVANSDGVPVGLSFMGWHGGDEALVELAGEVGAT